MKRIDQATPPAMEAELLLSFGRLSHQQDAEREIAALTRAAELFRREGDDEGVFISLGTLAKKQIWRRDLEAAEKAIADAEAVFDPSWPPAIREPVLQARTYLLEIRGRPAEGEPLMLELVDIMRALGNPRKVELALMELAESYMVQGKHEAAAGVHREVRDKMQARRAGYNATNLGNLAAALTQLNELDEALETARLAIPVMQRTNKLHVFFEHFALLAGKLGRMEEAARLLGKSDAFYEDSGFEREVSEERAHKLIMQLLEKALDEEVLERLMTEGAAALEEDLLKATILT